MVQDGSKMLKMTPMLAQDGLKMVQDGSKMAPRCLKTGPSWLKTSSRWLPEGNNMAQRRAYFLLQKHTKTIGFLAILALQVQLNEAKLS